MINDILFFSHYIVLLLFGVVLSFSFCSVRLTRKNVITAVFVFLVCGIIQLCSFFAFKEELVWKIYPLITHIPIGAFLGLVYKKRLSTIVSSLLLHIFAVSLPSG